jgi:long-chain fatty acid transport protein
VDVHGGRATGMAAAVTAMIDDASGVFYNPAGLAQGKGLDLEIGDTVIVPAFKFEDPAGVTTDGSKKPIPPPHFYASYGLTEEVTFGIGVFSPYGLVVEWPQGWDGRFQSARSELDTFYINPEVAVRATPWLRVGAGLQIVRAIAQLDRALNYIDSEGATHLAGGGWGVGGNAGVQVEAIPETLSFGATYRSLVNVDITGNSHFSGTPTNLQTLLQDQPVSTTAHLPQSISLGVAVRPFSRLRLSFNADYTGWQSIHELLIIFQNPTLNTYLPKRWKHTWNYHLGGEYELTDQWRLRGGILIDPTPSPVDTITPDLPDADRVNIALGGGYRWRNFRIDAGYQLVVITSVTSTAPAWPGKYSGVANLLSLTLGAKY